jgi:pSer/pThr/pTyr-binding forkhead associated (FHA) protein
LPVQVGKMQLQLKVLSGNHAGKLIAVNHDKFIIGRSEGCHLRPKSDSISRKHCAILHKEGKVLLVDLKSRNGTLVNDKKLEPTKAKVLKDGDKIQIGKLEFIAVMVAGIASVKKEEVKSVKDVVERTAASLSDSKFEEFDVSAWLDEADQIVRTGAEPDTRQFQFTSTVSEDTIMEAKAEQETRTDAPVKGKPGKVPPMSTKPTTASSKDAASETLRKFFSGGR